MACSPKVQEPGSTLIQYREDAEKIWEMLPDSLEQFRLGRKTIDKRMRRKLIAVNDRLRKLRNDFSFRKLYKHLCRILQSYYNYYGFVGNYATLNKFAYAIEQMWFRWLNRRSQRKSFNWEEFEVLLTRFPLPKPRILKVYRWI